MNGQSIKYLRLSLKTRPWFRDCYPRAINGCRSGIGPVLKKRSLNDKEYFMIHEILSQMPVGGELTIRETEFPKGGPFLVLTLSVPKKKYKISAPAIWKKDYSDTKVIESFIDLVYIYNQNCPL